MARRFDALALSRRSVLGAAGGALLASRRPWLGPRPVLAQGAGGTIRWSLEGINDLVSLDPVKATDAQDFTTITQLYSGLVRLDPTLKVEPDLAEKWTISDDGLVYTFTLRDGIKFSDGSPITADDAVWTFSHALDPKSGGWTGPYYLPMIKGAQDVISGKTKDLAGVKALDPKTVEITIDHPAPYLLSILAFGPSRFTSKAAGAAGTLDKGNVTSGAFSVKAWNHGQSLDTVPNPHYWQPSTVGLLQFVFNQESDTAYQLYRTGKLDIMGSAQNPIPAARVPEVKNSPDFHTTSAFNTRYVAFNNVLAPFDNVKTRQALAHAIDRDTLANQVLGGTVNPTDRILPAGFPGSELPIDGLKFDPATAKQLLSEAGVDAATFQFTLTYGVEGDNERVVTVLQSMWQENLGIKVTLEPLELSTYSSRLNDMYNDPKKGLQAYYSIWGADYPDPQNFLSMQLQTDVGNNNSHWSNAEFDKLTKEADQIVNDQEKRFQLYNQAEQIAVTDVGWLPLFNAQVNVLIRACLQGVELVPGGDLQVPDYSKLAACS
jgi:oligopeptide transport system substrate-binding protein